MKNHTDVSRLITGGISTYRFVCVDDISIFPNAPELLINETDIVLKAGKSWQQGVGDFNSMEYREARVDNAQGAFVEAEFSGFLPDDLYQNLIELQRSFNKKYVLQFTTRQGTRRIVGTKADGCTFSFDGGTSKAGGRKGMAFSFKKKAPRLSLYIREELVYFYINNLGQLIQQGENDDDFVVNTLGELVVTGPSENDYSLNASGSLLKQ
jgi:hypothetical protein